jgi:uncharacterized protein (TIGR02996 family)
MTLMGHPDEDRFIRGIATSPEDEVLRLVYSDWLEENGHDARSTYLRAEVGHFRTPPKARGEPDWVRAGEIDPVWRAMVSRASVGILVPGLTFSQTGPTVLLDRIRAIETHWGRPLPADYVAFLLLYNGGVPSREFLDRAGDHYSDAVHFFSTESLGGREKGTPPYLLQNMAEAVGRHDFPLGRYAHTVPIGEVSTWDEVGGYETKLGLDLDAAEQQIVVIAPTGGEEWYDDVPVATFEWAEDQRLFRKSFTHLLAGLIS